MEISDIRELHYITHIRNLPSILETGILCHKEAAKRPHLSVADEEVQARRAGKTIPNGLPLHHYANLYVNARNPMLFRNCKEYGTNQLCVICVHPDVLHLPNVVIADCNAAAGMARFYDSPDGLNNLDKEYVFIRYWTHHDPIEQRRRGQLICAEVLVPNRIEPQYLTGLKVVSEAVKQHLIQSGIALPIEVAPDFFFVQGN